MKYYHIRYDTIRYDTMYYDKLWVYILDWYEFGASAYIF